MEELAERERVELEAWLRDSEENQVLFEKIKKEIRISSESSLFRSLNDEVAWQKFKTTALRGRRAAAAWRSPGARSPRRRRRRGP